MTQLAPAPPGTLDTAAVPAFSSTRAPAATVVVIDVLRATSTIVTALGNGAAGIVPVREADEAIVVMRRLGRERAVRARRDRLRRREIGLTCAEVDNIEALFAKTFGIGGDLHCGRDANRGYPFCEFCGCLQHKS